MSLQFVFSHVSMEIRNRPLLKFKIKKWINLRKNIVLSILRQFCALFQYSLKVEIVRHILSRFGCLNRCEVFEGTSVRSCCDKQPCLLFLFGKGSVRSSEDFVVDMT
ncbi:hypothetical protein BpHYR1_032723 [Brachionus plicatilis]|uniref:Uncharacterized protein n=1 Tax=Brachionus plicatilis TaxID=10195 RepID=A0A3M7SJG3_BRAPC|nr:hypothetical protein BpHYR1_032723 [Brachionus plicatilis]